MSDSKTNMKCFNVCCDCSVSFSSVHLYEQKQALVGVLLHRHTVPIRQDPFCLSYSDEDSSSWSSYTLCSLSVGKGSDTLSGLPT